jgi:Protein of unknown function (DUF2892)
MTVERGLRLLAGIFVLISLALGFWVSHYWFLFTAFVGLNLFQSGLTDWWSGSLPECGCAAEITAPRRIHHLWRVV